MNRPIVIRRIIQAVALAFGVLGLLWVLLAFFFAFVGIRESDRFALVVMTPTLLVFGGIVLAIAWQNVRRFGPNAIRNVTALVILVLYACVPEWLYLRESTRSLGPFLDSALGLLPLILAYLLYRFFSRKLIQLTGVETNPHEAGEVPSEVS